MGPKSKKCIFLGYIDNVIGYRLWDPTTHKTIISRDGTTKKTDFWFVGNLGSFIELQRRHTFRFFEMREALWNYEEDNLLDVGNKGSIVELRRRYPFGDVGNEGNELLTK